MRRVGIKEFRDKATLFLASGETMLVERHGHPVGYFIPIKRKDDVVLQRLAEVIEHTLNEVGLGEEELIELFTVRQSGTSRGTETAEH